MGVSETSQWQTRQNGLESLVLARAPLFHPRDGEVLVEIRAVSLNYRDLEVAQGLYSHHQTIESGQPDALVPCSDMCGVVVAVGEGVAWNIGDRVVSTWNQGHFTGSINPDIMKTGLGLPLDGVLQTHRIFPADALLKAPKYMSDEEASCLTIAAVTAWMAINQFRPLGQPGGKGEIVLLQGTGGVSISGLQIAHAAGATTIITSSSDCKLARAKALGADHVINYRDVPSWDDEVMRISNKHGADIIFETGGAKTVRKSFNSVAYGGMIACIGYVSGKQDDADDRTNINVLALSRTVTLKGIINGPKDRFEEMLRFYEQHEIHPVIDRVFRFEEGRDAFAYLEGGSHFGKVVIKVKSSVKSGQ
ncbi:PKS-ER domain-containing protein [Fusarium falciforme]|uniref:PKS-ER domain-containing protein n=1 Tax=Fusarium falciforme TaxID=195108 RepID=UPI002301C91C|nr:PKS-ER domain-containing protein [Fusarium falciforme]WAO96680.1 PKS-ER domain-containing protein [Fusarium falciforme]